MSTQANVMSSFAVLLQQAAEAARIAAGLEAIDTELDSLLADPYPSLRLNPAGSGHGNLERVSLWLVTLRIDDLVTDEWTRTTLRDELISAIGFSTASQTPYRAQGPLYDFQASDNPPVIGVFTVELVGSQTWQIRRDGNIWLCSSKFNLFS